MSVHTHLLAFENAIVRNKWFALASVTLLMAFSLGCLAVLHASNGGASCYLEAEKALFGPRAHRIFAHEVTTEVVTTARTYYTVCLLTNGIDVRSVPAFEELFPFTSELNNYANNESYTDIDVPLE